MQRSVVKPEASTFYHAAVTEHLVRDLIVVEVSSPTAKRRFVGLEKSCDFTGTIFAAWVNPYIFAKRFAFFFCFFVTKVSRRNLQTILVHTRISERSDPIPCRYAFFAHECFETITEQILLHICTKLNAGLKKKQ